jgi:uncharacterized protein YraI
MKKISLVLILVWIAGISMGCSGQATPDPTQVAEAVQATMTAQAVQTPDPTLIAKIAAKAVQSTLTAQAELTPEATDTPTFTPTPEATETPTPAPTNTPTPQPTATPTPVPQPEAVVTSKSLNVRAGPGTSHPIVTVINAGESYPILASNKDASWMEIQLPTGKSGWVASKLIEIKDYGQKIEVAEVIPTPPPAPKKPASAPKTLQVEFKNPHYECQQKEWNGQWGYRSFQADLYIKNNGTVPVEPPWKPSRWIITDGKSERESKTMWQWVSRRTGFYKQPTIHPGESAGWTFLAFPIDRNEWVKAAEFEWNGQIYRQEFDLGPFNNNYNYQDCGPPAPHS